VPESAGDKVGCIGDRFVDAGVDPTTCKGLACLFPTCALISPGATDTLFDGIEGDGRGAVICSPTISMTGSICFSLQDRDSEGALEWVVEQVREHILESLEIPSSFGICGRASGALLPSACHSCLASWAWSSSPLRTMSRKVLIVRASDSI